MKIFDLLYCMGFHFEEITYFLGPHFLVFSRSGNHLFPIHPSTPPHHIVYLCPGVAIGQQVAWGTLSI